MNETQNEEKRSKLSYFKEHKKITALLIIVIILIATPSIFMLVKFIDARIGVKTERNYVSYMKGVWEPGFPALLTALDITRMKEDNINILSLGPTIYAGPYDILDEQFVLSLIKHAKDQGLAVHIAPQVEGGMGGDPDAITEETLNQFTEKVLYWAGLCEQYGVEYFSPMNEADHALHRDKAVEWHSEVLPKIREVFTGEVFAKWSNYDDDDYLTEEVDALLYRVEASVNFDGVMLDFSPPLDWQAKYYFDPTRELDPEDQYRPASLYDLINATSQKANQLGIPIYVGEFYFETLEPPGGTDRIILTEEERAEWIGKFLDTVMPCYDGVLYCHWVLPGSTVKDTPSEEVMKERFGMY
ncbi:MAG: hypothetical protein ACFFD2_30710 [Promethearchaeota archaeon]